MKRGNAGIRFFLFLSLFSLKAHAIWKIYSSSREIRGIVEEGNYVWVAVHGTGVYRCEVATENCIHFTRAEGLPSDDVTGITLDELGRKWLSSKAGLILWLSKSMKLFTTADGLPGDNITAISFNEYDGRIYFGVNGLIGRKLSDYSFETTGYYEGEIRSIAFDSQGNVWVGGFPSGAGPGGGGGLCVIGNWAEGITYCWTTSNSPILSNYVYSVAVDSSGNKWIGTKMGLNKFDGVNWNSYLTNGYPVYSVSIDEDGAVWLALGTDSNTEGGVQKYDGTAWYTYTKSNSPLLSNKVYWVSAIRGNVWIGTDGGLNRLEREHWNAYNFITTGISSNSVWGIALEGNIKWLATQPSGNMRGGVSSFDDAEWVNYLTSNSGLSSNEVYDAAVDLVGKKWFATNGGGVSVFDGRIWTVYTQPDLPSSYAFDVEINPLNGEIWVGTFSGAAVYNGLTWIQYTTSNSGIARNFVWSIDVDGYGRIWFAHRLDGGGVSMFDGSSWKVYDTTNSGIASDYINDMDDDLDGSMWFANYFDGVSHFDESNNRWENFNTSNSGLLSDTVYSVFVDSSGRKWFGTAMGVSMYYNGVWTNFPEVGSVEAFEEDYYYNIWAASTGKGLARFDGSGWVFFDRTNTGIIDPNVQATRERGGLVVFGTGGGASLFNYGVWTGFNTTNSGIASNNVSDAGIDSDNSIWFTHNGEGVSYYNGVSWIVYTNQNTNGGLASDFVQCMTIDALGRKWFGTDSGASYFDGMIWNTINTANSCLQNNYINYIYADRNGGVWLGTNGGGATYYKDGFPSYCTTYSALFTVYGISSEDSETFIWFATGSGARRYNTITGWWDEYVPPSGTSCLNSAGVDRNNLKYFGTCDGTGLWRLDTSGTPQWQLFTSSNSPLTSNSITDIYVSEKGDRWFSTLANPSFDGGANVLVEVKWSSYPSMFSDVIVPFLFSDIAIDVDNSAWFAGRDGGVFHFDGVNYEVFNASNSPLPPGEVRTAAISNTGVKWFGGMNSSNYPFLARFDGTNWDIYDYTNSCIPSIFNASIEVWAVDSSGAVWTSIWNNGVIKFISSSNCVPYNTGNSSISSNRVHSLFVDSSGIVWIGHGEGAGVDRFDGSTWTNYNPSNSGIKGDIFWDITEDVSTATMWFVDAFYVNVFDGTNWKTYEHKKAGSWHGWQANAIEPDPSGSVWVLGAYGDYVSEIDFLEGEYWRRIHPHNTPLPEGEVVQNAWTRDGYKRIWYPTFSGKLGLYIPNFSQITTGALDYSTSLTWNVNDKVLSYINFKSVVIFRSLSFSGHYKPIYSSSTLSGTYLDEDFLHGQTHYYWLGIEDTNGNIYMDVFDKVYVRPLREEKPEFLFYSVDPARTGKVGNYVDYPLVIEPRDNFVWEIQLSLKDGYSLPQEITHAFIPSLVSCNWRADGESCAYNTSVLRLFINGYPSSCALSGRQRCVIPLQAKGFINGVTEVVKYEKILLNIIDPNDTSDSFISLYFYPDDEGIEVGDEVELRGHIFPNPKTCDQGDIIVTSTFSPPGQGSPLTLTSPVNSDGWFFLKFRPQYSGDWSLMSGWSGSTPCGLSGGSTADQPSLSPPNMRVEKARTTISLYHTANENTAAGESVTVTVKIGPNPGIVPVNVSVTNPDNTPNTNGTFNTSATGVFSFSFTARSGYMKVRASWDGNSDYYGSSAETTIPIQTPIGMGIIIAGKSSSNFPQLTIDNLVKKAYRSLRNRNISSQRIYLLHPNLNFDADGDGQADTDALSTKSNFQYAVTTWASELVEIGSRPDCDTYAPYRTPLTIYLVGYGYTDWFMTGNNEKIYDADLKNYLQTLLSNIQARYLGCTNPPPSEYPVNIIIEVPRGGSFIDNAASSRRIIISSVNSSQNPHLDNNGNVSYSMKFYDYIDGGKYIGVAHSSARDYIQSLYSDQTPQLDADGDGVPNEINDELQAAEERLEFRPAGDMEPTIEGVKGEQVIVQSSYPPATTAQLWATVEDREDDYSKLSVWALITPPSNSYESPATIVLTPSSPTFQGNYSGFYGEGVYTVLYLAKDSAGNTAVARSSSVSVNDSVAPLDITGLQVNRLGGGQLYITWSPSSSQDTQGYLLKVFIDGNYVETVDAGNVAEYTYQTTSPGEYTFQVVAYDRKPNYSNGVSSSGIITGNFITQVGITEKGLIIVQFEDESRVLFYDIYMNGEKLREGLVPGEYASTTEKWGDVVIVVHFSDGGIEEYGPFTVGNYYPPKIDFPEGVNGESYEKPKHIPREEERVRVLLLLPSGSYLNVMDSWLNMREKQNFEIEFDIGSSLNVNLSGFDVVIEILENRDGEIGNLSDAVFYSFLHVKSPEELEEYLKRVMEFESNEEFIYELKADSIIYNGEYYINVREMGNEGAEEPSGKWLATLFNRGDKNREWRYYLTTGSIHLFHLGKSYMLKGDPLIFIKDRIYSSTGEPSFGCRMSPAFR